MLGTRTSIPNSVLPFTLSGMSSRGVDFPSRRKVVGSLSGTSPVGTGCLAASAARSPYDAVRLDGPWVTTLAIVEHSDAGTPHRAAAAATSIARAVAPARRSGMYELRVLWLPPVPVLYLPLVGARATRTLLQSASSSSATIIGIAVHTPCPISDLADWMVIVPSGSIVSQRFGVQPSGATSGAPGVSLAASASSVLNPSMNAAPVPAETATNWRRVIVFLLIWPPHCRPRGGSRGGCAGR